MAKVKDHLGNEYDSESSMCKAYGIKPACFWRRMNSGWTLEKALCTRSLRENTECFDHLGNRYPSVTDMCKAYGLSRQCYLYRKKQGLSIQEALNPEKRREDISCIDHLGNHYKSISSMCRKYGIDRHTYTQRIKDGWSVEDALCIQTLKASNMKTQMASCAKTQNTTNECLDHLGNRFSSTRAMCREYGIDINCFLYRISHGWSLERALCTESSRKDTSCSDHLGNIFQTESEMCATYGVKLTTYKQRLKRNWTVKDALTKVPVPRYNSCEDGMGHAFSSETEMCKFHNIDRKIYVRRKQLGWTTIDALTPERKTTGKECMDHLGRRYSSLNEMCRAYGISFGKFKGRRRQNWSIEDILTKIRDFECEDHNGNKYESISAMCKHYGIPFATYEKRISKYGWSIEEALTIPKNSSLGEERIANYLDEIGIEYYHDITLRRLFKEIGAENYYSKYIDVTASNLNSRDYGFSKDRIERMRFDFSLIHKGDLFAFIEFDGEQHFAWIDVFFSSLENFLLRHKADKIKTTFSEKGKIPLLRIRYDQVDSIPIMIDDLVSHPIKYIDRHNTFLSNEDYWSVFTLDVKTNIVKAV